MKKMRLKKTVLSVALAMSGLCIIPVTQAADALEELQNLGTQVATIKYGDIMNNISKAIAEGNIDVVPQALDDLISLNQSVIDRDVLQYQKLIDTSKTVL